MQTLSSPFGFIICDVLTSSDTSVTICLLSFAISYNFVERVDISTIRRAPERQKNRKPIVIVENWPAGAGGVSMGTGSR